MASSVRAQLVAQSSVASLVGLAIRTILGTLRQNIAGMLLMMRDLVLKS